MSRATLFRKERRARGLCAVAGCPEVTGESSYRCQVHARAHRAAEQERYDVRVGGRQNRAPGTGAISLYQGSYRIRWRENGEYAGSASFPTYQEAEAALAEIVAAFRERAANAA